MSESKQISRRKFLKIAGLSLGGAVVACSGITYTATRQPKIDFIQTSCAGNNDSQGKILVAYGSKCGSTGEVAEAIGQTLCEKGASVDVSPAGRVTSLEGYRLVILGSAVRMGNWVSEAVEFVKTNQQELLNLPVVLFTVHLQNTGDDEESRNNRLAYLNTVRPLVNSVGEAFFAGKIEMARLSFLDRSISQIMGAKDKDLRDWNKIRSWAQTVTI
jgi:menaquinone-dependent protoporphyrinogen oxidase